MPRMLRERPWLLVVALVALLLGMTITFLVVALLHPPGALPAAN